MLRPLSRHMHRHACALDHCTARTVRDMGRLWQGSQGMRRECCKQNACALCHAMG